MGWESWTERQVDALGIREAWESGDLDLCEKLMTEKVATDGWHAVCALASAGYVPANAPVRKLIHIANRVKEAARPHRERQAAKKQERSRGEKDPYWSLWGCLKARCRADERHEVVLEEIEEGYGETNFGVHLGRAEDDEYQENRPPLKLPRRGVSVDIMESASGWTLYFEGGRTKKVHSDTHAVNALRKLDTDEGYWAQHEERKGILRKRNRD